MKKHLPLLLGAAVFFCIQACTGQGCVSRWMFGVSCPACGMTRALLCLLALDLEGYFHYQPMALPMTAAVALLIHSDCKGLKPYRRIIAAGTVTVCLVNLALFFCKG